MKKFLKIYLIFSFFIFSLLNCFIGENTCHVSSIIKKNHLSAKHYTISNSDNDIFIATPRKTSSGGFLPDIDTIKWQEINTKFDLVNKKHNYIIANNPKQLFKTEIFPNAP